MTRIVKKPAERRLEIVLASRDLFLRQGYEKTTLQDVMTKLNIAKGTTYHYFKSKEDLLDAVIDNIVTEYISDVQKALKNFKGNALKKMQNLITVGRVATDQKSMLDNLHRPANMGMHVRLLAVTISKLAPLYATIIKQGCKEKLFQVDNPLECAEILLAGIQFVTDTGCYPWDDHDLERRQKAIPALIENLLNAPKGSFNFLFN